VAALLSVAAALTGTALALSCLVDHFGVDLLVDRGEGVGAVPLPAWYVAASPFLAAALAAAAGARSLGRRWHARRGGGGAAHCATDGDCCAPEGKAKAA